MLPQPDHSDSRLSQLERILESAVFRDSERMSRFLRYVVEETVSGRADQLKEYVIGIEVYDKPETYDPRVDSTVRGEAGKLRNRLAKYYETDGRNDPIIVTIPKGTYAAEFEKRTVVEMPLPPDPSAKTPARLVAKPQLLHRLGLPATVIVALVTTVAAAILILPRPPGSGQPGKGTAVRLTWDNGLAVSPALSREGKLVVYASDRAGKDNLDIWLQPVNGTEALRLTDDPADDSDPDISPDGSRVAFWSARDGGGIYIMSAVGGPARLIAKGGKRPRFSPDGTRIAFHTGDDILFHSAVASGKVFVLRLETGEVRQIASKFSDAMKPIWAPDGDHVIFQGYPDSDFAAAKTDWWVARVSGGEPVKTGIREHLLETCGNWVAYPPAGWIGASVVFAIACGGPMNLWSIPIQPKTWKVAGPATRITAGTASESAPASSADGSIAFTSNVRNSDIWALPVDPDMGRVTGEIKRLTSSAANEQYPSVSADGKLLVYSLRRGSEPDIWLKNLETGQERELVSGPGVQNYREISRDGKSVTYHEVIPDPKNLVAYRHVGWRIAVAGGAPEKLCDDCTLMGFVHDAGFLLDHGPRGFDIWDVRTKVRTNYLTHSKFELLGPVPSPDQRLLAFTAKEENAQQRLYVTRFPKGKGPSSEEWHRLGEGSMPVWSPNGSYLYFASARDGYQCLWVQRLNPDSGNPVGDAAALSHFHSPAKHLSPGAVVFRWMSMASDKLVFPVEERSASVWFLKAK